MTRLRIMTSVALFAIVPAACERQTQANASSAGSESIAAAPAPRLITLPDSETAVAMTPPVLPARLAGDCPSDGRSGSRVNHSASRAYRCPVDRKDVTHKGLMHCMLHTPHEIAA